jgi:hypothetical protein
MRWKKANDYSIKYLDDFRLQDSDMEFIEGTEGIYKVKRGYDLKWRR